MTSYAKNNYRADRIQRFGVTTGTPLFEAVNKTLSDLSQTRLDAAPKSIPTGAETRRLAHTILQHDPLHLSEINQKVWEAFAEFGPATNFEIAQRLDKESGYISARNNDLRKLGLLTSDAKRRCNVTGNIVQTWKVK
jgi:hypothetical protein